MKIKCTKLIDKDTRLSKISDGEVTVGNSYDVICFLFNFGEPKKYGVKFQLYVNGEMKNEPSLLDESDFFEIVDHTIPSNMGIFIDMERKQISIEPRSFQEYKSTREEWSDFWNDLYEEERSAIELYRKEVAFIKGETYEPLSPTKPDAKELLEIYRRRERDGLIPNQGFNEAFEPMALTSTENWKP
jgi:hypothetical protein